MTNHNLVRNVIEENVMEWIADLPLSTLRHMAEQNEDATAKLFRGYNHYTIKGIRMSLGRAAVQRVRDMREEDYQALIDRVLETHPLHGEIIFEHEEWFIRQVKLARERFLA